jgi:DNA topoisomerase-3
LEKPFDRYIIATDAGREGELIARLVLNYAGLNDYSKVFRFWTSSALTKDVILDCLENLKPAASYDDLFAAGLYRQLSDWLVGINFSRFFSVKLNGKFVFGRVQTPVLNLIVSREREIASFVKSYFYRLQVSCSALGSVFVSHLLNPEEDINWIDRQIPEALIPELSGVSTVSDVQLQLTTLNPPRLFDLTELQKSANTKFGFSAQKTLELAQTLYEKHKCLSYPRTASRYLSRVNAPLFIQALDTLGIPHGPVDTANKNIFNDEAMEKNKEDHHALILLNKLPEDAGDDEKKIFLLVLNNMADIVKNPHVFKKITLTHTLAGHSFRASGVKVLEPGWKEGKTADTGDEDTEPPQELPELAKGDQITLTNPELTTHERKPPKSFTEASLLTAMKKFALGTVATRDGIIEGLVKNEYCLRKGKSLVPQDKALFLIDSVNALDHSGLQKYLDVSTTEEWEAMLEDQPEAFFDRMKDFIASTLNAVKSGDLKPFKPALGVCPKCGAAVISGKFSFFCSRHKESSCDFSIGRIICNADISENDLTTLLSGKKTTLKNMRSKNGKDFQAALRLDQDHNVKFEFPDTKK